MDFSSLVDVRIVKHGKSASVEPAVGTVDSVELAAAKVNGDSAKDPSIAVNGGDDKVKDSAGSLPQGSLLILLVLFPLSFAGETTEVYRATSKII